MSDIIGMALGTHTLIVGVEQDPDEPDLTRVYVGARYLCRYVLVSGDDAERAKRAWGSSQHCTTPMPDAYYVDDEQLARIAERNEALL